MALTEGLYPKPVALSSCDEYAGPAWFFPRRVSPPPTVPAPQSPRQISVPPRSEDVVPDPERPIGVVAFDFDGTLTVRDSFKAFLTWDAKEGKVVFEFEPRASKFPPRKTAAAGAAPAAKTAAAKAPAAKKVARKAAAPKK